MSKVESIVLGGGCFWCTETVFKQLRGVIEVVPGYAGGERANPTYEQVCGGDTGHAEVIKIDYDSGQISIDDLLSVFFSVHDPTTLNRQGHDMGTQYRSIIFFNTSEQEMAAKNKIGELESEKVYNDPIVTEIKPLDKFYEAEDYHHDYFAKNPDQTYCQLIIK
ncbi:MAG: peptide-methionine (S)-S-oxide reductase MsrA [Candidatus Magasanikbacteria bacterium]|nr:peptide-methionine (S)-S-oxide reductase MsrA [Candidatus Magasanikbacteria bacterium]